MDINKNTVAIMMATYNGESFLQEQLDSLINQTYENWILFIRDDNSIDNTRKIIDIYCKQYAEKIYFIEDHSLPSGGAKNNFVGLYQWVTKRYDFSYYMFCDQDDVWLPQKIEQSVNTIKKEEMQEEIPLLFHSDLIVVDQKLNIINDSYMKYRVINGNVNDINHLLIQNNVTGCTMLWNRKLNDMIKKTINTNIVMHDWWIALIACLYGKIVFSSNALIYYRQHNKNVVGATKVSSFRFVLMRLKDIDHVKFTLSSAVEQAEHLYRCSQNVDDYKLNVMKTFCSLKKKNKIQKVNLILKYHFFKQGWIQIIGELLFI
ncbi:MAG: glycosyltransferase family 2 protein [Clostridium sp.]|nr:glycosyltransferase family 2 protein [Clostridium sp.]